MNDDGPPIGLQEMQDAAISRGHAHPQPIPDLGERVRAFVAEHEYNLTQPMKLVPAGGMEDFLMQLIKRREEHVREVAAARLKLYELDERIEEIMNEVQHTGQIHGCCIRWKKCGDSYNGWTCDLRMGHEEEETVCCKTFPAIEWHSDRNAGKQWRHE